jgi:copper chaperone CopZ
MNKYTMKIDGMACAMCEAHIKEVIRKAIPSAKKLAASHTKGEASFLTEEAVDEGRLREAIAATGYTCMAISSELFHKKGWFR